VGDARTHPRDRLLGIGRKALEDGLDRRRVVAHAMADLPRHARPHDQRRHAHAVGGIARGLIEVKRRRHDMVVEPAVLAGDVDEQRVIPLGAVAKRLVDIKGEGLAARTPEGGWSSFDLGSSTLKSTKLGSIQETSRLLARVPAAVEDLASTGTRLSPQGFRRL
jgi:hypothetical protein